MIKILQFNLLLTVFLIPIITPFQSYGYELSRILFFIFLTSLSGFLWLWLAHRKKIKLRWNKVKITSLIFVIILLFTSLLGIDPVFSLLGKEPYFQGWVIYVYLWLFSVMVATTPIEPKKRIIAFNLAFYTQKRMVAGSNWFKYGCDFFKREQGGHDYFTADG